MKAAGLAAQDAFAAQVAVAPLDVHQLRLQLLRGSRQNLLQQPQEQV
jgi:hypothetical protein